MAGFSGPHVDKGVASETKSEVDPNNKKTVESESSVKSRNGDSKDTVSVHNNPTYNSDGYFDFNGTNQYFSVSNASYLNPSNITIFIWVYFDTIEHNRILVSKRTSSSLGSYMLGVSSTNVLTFETYEDSEQSLSQKVNFSAGKWYNIVATFGRGYKKIYVNGEEVASVNVSNSLSLTSSSSNLTIGTDSYMSQHYLNGRIGMINIFGITLSDRFVRFLYKIFSKRVLFSSNLGSFTTTGSGTAIDSDSGSLETIGTVSITPPSGTLDVGNNHTYSASYSGTVGSVTWSWNIGGSPTIVSQTGNQITVNWSNSGTYTIQVTATASNVSDSPQTASINSTISAAAPPLYSFTTHTFTSAGKSGDTGPTFSDCQTAYGSAAFMTSYFSVSGGIQQWTAPETGTYEIELRGGSGGEMSSTHSYRADPGQGALIITRVTLTRGTSYNIVVGQIANFGTNGSAGGGGSWMYTGSIGGSGLIAVAGGGGGTGHGRTGTGGNGLGGNNASNGDSRRVSAGTVINGKTGNGTGSTNGIGYGGGVSSTGNYGGAAGGAGWLSDGTDQTSGTRTCEGGHSSGPDAWIGGSSARGASHHGGFGGGGGSNGNCCGGGGGGGYTGGPAGNDWSGTEWGNAGGGGSFWTGTLVSATKGDDGGTGGHLSANATNGYVKITKIT